MTSKEMFEALEQGKKMTHPLLEGGWVMKCNCGHYHNSNGYSYDKDEMVKLTTSELKKYPELSNGWEEVK